MNGPGLAAALLLVAACACIGQPGAAQPAPRRPNATAQPAAHRPDTAAGQRLANNGKADSMPPCAQCHGQNGVPDPATGFPRLPGQTAQYLYKQLRDYASGQRDNPIMGPIASALSDAERQDVSAYYAAMDSPYPAPAAQDPKQQQDGAALANLGSGDRRVQACANCHGPAGTGMAPLYPRLAGQYAAYATAQFEAFRGGSRKNDVGAVMRDIARNLPDEDVTAVANYLESLRPGEKASP